MRGATLVHWLAAATAVQLSAAGVIGLTSEPPRDPQVLGVSVAKADKPKDNNGTGDDKQVILASGTVVGLFPGAVKDLPVLLENRNNFDVAVTRLSAGVVDAAPGCDAANIRVEDFTGRRTVPGNGSATQALVIRMRNDAPNECKDVVWQMTYSGQAEKDKL